MAPGISRKEKKTEERRKQILEAAIAVFSQKGYASTTVPEIAEAAGLATGTLYLYFPNKRDLFLSSVKNLIFTTPLLSLIGKVPTGNPEEIFKKILLNRFQLLKNQGSTVTNMPTLLGEIMRDSELRDVWLTEFLHPFFKRMEQMYSMLKITGKVRSVEPTVMVRTIGGLILGFLVIRMMEGELSPMLKLEQEKVAEDVTQILLYGLLFNEPGKKAKKEGKK